MASLLLLGLGDGVGATHRGILLGRGCHGEDSRWRSLDMTDVEGCVGVGMVWVEPTWSGWVNAARLALGSGWRVLG